MHLIQIDQLSPSYSFCIRFCINIITAFVLIKFIYFKFYKNKENVFLFSIFNLLIFIITFLLNSVNMGIGSAFGLFAVFSMLQYRTTKISAKDMTYIFILITIGLIDAVSIISLPILVLISVVLLAVTYFLESGLFLKRESSQVIVYTNLELIKPACRAELIQDLEFRLGVTICTIAIKEVDFFRKTALIHLCYLENSQDHESFTNSYETKFPKVNSELFLNGSYKVIDRGLREGKSNNIIGGYEKKELKKKKV